MHLHQITAIVAEGNLPSRILMSDAGFTKVAVLNEWLFTTEGYKNAILLQKIL
jgi:L-amino acid N-acyltransferase YncA